MEPLTGADDDFAPDAVNAFYDAVLVFGITLPSAGHAKAKIASLRSLGKMLAHARQSSARGGNR